MKIQEAGQVLALLNAGFPSEALEPASAELWIEEIALLKNPEIALRAARQQIRQGERFPSIKQFRDLYRSLDLSSRPEPVRAIEPPYPTSRQVPEWVQDWLKEL